MPIPLDIGSDNTNMSTAPKYLLKLGLQNVLENNGFKVSVLPQIYTPKKSSAKMTKDQALKEILKVIKDSNKAVKGEILKGNKVLSIGGDHAIAIGTIGGAAEALKGDLGLIWIDAHGDLNTHETSPSGNVHGMSSAILLGFGDKKLDGLVKNKIKKENILFIGLKDLDQPEIDRIRKNKLSAITMFDIMMHGFPLIAEKVQSLKKRVNNIWITMDLDSVEKSDAPASAMATSGGLTYREVTNLLSYIGRTTNVVGLDIVEVTPNSDINNKTGRLCIELVAEAFGTKYNWYSEYMHHYEGK